jgi:hypothetical protein
MMQHHSPKSSFRPEIFLSGTFAETPEKSVVLLVFPPLQMYIMNKEYHARSPLCYPVIYWQFFWALSGLP